MSPSTIPPGQKFACSELCLLELHKIQDSFHAGTREGVQISHLISVFSNLTYHFKAYYAGLEPAQYKTKDL